MGAGVGVGLVLLARGGVAAWSHYQARAQRKDPPAKDKEQEMRRVSFVASSATGDATATTDLDTPRGPQPQQDQPGQQQDQPGQQQDQPGQQDQQQPQDDPVDPLVAALQAQLVEKQQHLRRARLEWERQQKERAALEAALQEARDAMDTMHQGHLEELGKTEGLAMKYLDERDLYL